MTNMVREKIEKQLEKAINHVNKGGCKELREANAMNNFAGYLKAMEDMGFINSEEYFEYVNKFVDFCYE